jgi:hypothetical protein
MTINTIISNNMKPHPPSINHHNRRTDQSPSSLIHQRVIQSPRTNQQTNQIQYNKPILAARKVSSHGLISTLLSSVQSNNELRIPNEITTPIVTPIVPITTPIPPTSSTTTTTATTSYRKSRNCVRKSRNSLLDLEKKEHFYHLKMKKGIYLSLISIYLHLHLSIYLPYYS